MMFRNHLKVAWRSLRRSSFYSIINVFGLAFGLSTAILLLLWVQGEKSFDKFHSDYPHIYRVLARLDKETVFDITPGPIRNLSLSMPQTQSVVRINDDSDQVISTSDKKLILDGFHTAFVDSTFFTFFDFELASGHRRQLFPNINSVVLTQKTARKFFGREDVEGETILFRKTLFTITGVLKDFPQNSSLSYDALFPLGFYAKTFTENGGNGEWRTIDEDMGNYNFKTFVKLKEGTDATEMARTLTATFKKTAGIDVDVQLNFQPIEEMHLAGLGGSENSSRMIGIFTAIAILILAIAAVNYVNLATARAVVRMREIGIRKLVGAAKTQLFFQFMTETIVLFGLSLLLAAALVVALSPLYKMVSGNELQFALESLVAWKMAGFAVVGTLLGAALYPALFLSGFQPLEALKGRYSRPTERVPIRKVLVVFQFAVSGILIISTLVIGRQMKHIREMNLGYDKEQVLTVALPGSVVQHVDALKNELAAADAVEGVALSDIFDIGNHTNATGDLVWDGKSQNSLFLVYYASVDRDFIPMMKLNLLEGRNFEGQPSDSSSFIINETAAKAMGLKAPLLGQTLRLHDRAGTIIGVLKDFNFMPLTTKIAPMIITHKLGGNILYVRAKAKNVAQAVASVEKSYKKYAAGIPFTYSFIDRHLAGKYLSDTRSGLLFNIFAGVAIFISCLGLIGLTTYSLGQRVREIGIRKTLGATTTGIVKMLSVGTVFLAAVSFLVATPIAWWMMEKWLQNFAYRIEVEWWIFCIAGLTTILIALLTVGLLSVRAALANPVNAIKSE